MTHSSMTVHRPDDRVTLLLSLTSVNFVNLSELQPGFALPPFIPDFRDIRMHGSDVLSFISMECGQRRALHYLCFGD